MNAVKDIINFAKKYIITGTHLINIQESDEGGSEGGKKREDGPSKTNPLL